MAVNPNYEQIGKAFTQQYYALFDNAAQRPQLAALYNAEQSLMTFEGEQRQGAVKIMEKFASLTFQSIQHLITAVDCQPTFDGGILINVLGQLKTDDDPAQSFAQTFVLKPLNDSFFIQHENFRLFRKDDYANMFRDIFNGTFKFQSQFSDLNSETTSLEMHYITRTGSLEIDVVDALQVCHFDTCVGSSSDEEEQQRWNEDPFSGRLSVVDSAFSTLPPHLIDKHWNWVTILDLSRNHIEDPDFIVYFEHLETLILDHNRIGEQVVFPRCVTLTTLWLNFNHINSLFPFGDSLEHSFPKLKYLSMMGNPAVPSLLTEGSKFHDYIMYRLYLVSRLPFLSYLDDRTVEWEERKEAQSMYHIASKSLKCGLRGNPSDFSNKAAIEAGINPSPSTSTSPLHSTTRQQTAFAWKQKLKILWEDIVLRTGAPQSL